MLVRVNLKDINRILELYGLKNIPAYFDEDEIMIPLYEFANTFSDRMVEHLNSLDIKDDNEFKTMVDSILITFKSYLKLFCQPSESVIPMVKALFLSKIHKDLEKVICFSVDKSHKDKLFSILEPFMKEGNTITILCRKNHYNITIDKDILVGV